jgi:hypothetical protein
VVECLSSKRKEEEWRKRGEGRKGRRKGGREDLFHKKFTDRN